MNGFAKLRGLNITSRQVCAKHILLIEFALRLLASGACFQLGDLNSSTLASFLIQNEEDVCLFSSSFL
jgi:hypothetical protein